jgi:hypothetical protein
VGGEIATNERTPVAAVGLESPTNVKGPGQNSTIEPTLAALGYGGQFEEIYLAREQEQCFTTGGRGSARLSSPKSVRAGTGWEEARQDPRPQESGTGCQDARQEPRPPENGSSPPARDIATDSNDGDDTVFDDESDRQQTAEWIRASLARMVALRAEKPRELNEEIRREAKLANNGRRSRRDWHKNDKPANRAKKRAAHTKPRTTGTNAARTAGDSAELVNGGSGLTIRARPA